MVNTIFIALLWVPAVFAAGIEYPGDLIENTLEKYRSYSTAWDDSAPGGVFARSQLNSLESWVPFVKDQNQWVIIDMTQEQTVTGFAIQKRKTADQYVTKLNFYVSKDGTTFDLVGEFEGSLAGDATADVRRVRIPEPVVARYVKFNPLEWNGHPSMRCGVVIYDGVTPTTTTTAPTTTLAPQAQACDATFFTDGTNAARCNAGQCWAYDDSAHTWTDTSDASAAGTERDTASSGSSGKWSWDASGATHTDGSEVRFYPWCCDCSE